MKKLTEKKDKKKSIQNWLKKIGTNVKKRIQWKFFL